MVRIAILLDALRVAPGENELELLLLSSRPNVVVNLVVLSPHLESLVVVDLEEVVAHLVVRQNLPIIPSLLLDLRIFGRNHGCIHPVPVIIVSLHHLKRQSLLQPRLLLTPSLFPYFRQSCIRLSKVVLVENNENLVVLRQKVVAEKIDLIVIEIASVEILFVVCNVGSIHQNIKRTMFLQKGLEFMEIAETFRSALFRSYALKQ